MSVILAYTSHKLRNNTSRSRFSSYSATLQATLWWELWVYFQNECPIWARLASDHPTSTRSKHREECESTSTAGLPASWLWPNLEGPIKSDQIHKLPPSIHLLICVQSQAQESPSSTTSPSENWQSLIELFLHLSPDHFALRRCAAPPTMRSWTLRTQENKRSSKQPGCECWIRSIPLHSCRFKNVRTAQAIWKGVCKASLRAFSIWHRFCFMLRAPKFQFEPGEQNRTKTYVETLDYLLWLLGCQIKRYKRYRHQTHHTINHPVPSAVVPVVLAL